MRTPDPVLFSSANTSSESALDLAEAGTAAGDNKLANLKVGHSYETHSLHMGGWKEIDGEESAYYHSDN